MDENSESPTPGSSPDKAGGGFLGIKKHWQVWSIGIGGATILVMIIIWRSSKTPASTATDLGYSLPSGSTNGSGTSGSNTMSTDSLNSMMQSLSTLEAQNANALQQLITNGIVTNPGIQDNSGNPIPTGSPLPDSLVSFLAPLDPSNPAKMAAYTTGGRSAPGWVTLQSDMTAAGLAAKYNDPFGFSDIAENPLNAQYKKQINSSVNGTGVLAKGSKVWVP